VVLIKLLAAPCKANIMLHAYKKKVLFLPSEIQKPIDFSHLHPHGSTTVAQQASDLNGMGITL
jgi:hypothetical protein